MSAQADEAGPHRGTRRRYPSQDHTEFSEQVNTKVLELVNSSYSEPYDSHLIQDACDQLIQALHARVIERQEPLRLDDLCSAVMNLRNLSNSLMSNAHLSRDPSKKLRSPSPLIGTPTRAVTTASTPLSVSASVQATETENNVAMYKNSIEEWGSALDSCDAIQEATKQARQSKHDKKSEFELKEAIETFLDKLNRWRSSFVEHFENLQHLNGDDKDQRDKCKAAIRFFFDDPASEHLVDSQVLPALLRSLPLSPEMPPATEDPEEEPLRKLLARNIRRNYRGNAPSRLLDFAMKVNRIFFHERPEDQRPYIKGTPIVQSSGTGKTRMVLELGRIAPLLFLCIRPVHIETARNGYPLGDKPMVEFIFQECAKSAAGNNEQAAVLLAAWFDTLAFKLHLRPTPEDKVHLLTGLNDYGSVDHEREREDFFKSVVTKAQNLLKKAPTSGDYTTIFDRHLNKPVAALAQQLEDVRECMARKDPRVRSAPVFVAIDECVALPSELLVSIRRAWNHIGRLEMAKTKQGSNTLPFWLILMSTSSGASSLVRSQSEQPSNRDKASVALPTFVGVGFDVFRTEQRPLQTAGGVGRTDYITFYGRPLWQALLDENFWSTAILKLLGTQQFQRGIRVTCFNIMASRLALRFVPVRGADGSLFGEQLSFSHQGVDRHMRILVKVETDSSLHIRSPSEPVLAIAASLVLMPTPASAREDGGYGGKAENRYGSILETLKANCLASANIDILKGARGELMARLLLMTAWDAAKVVDAEWFSETESYAAKAQHLLKPVALDAILRGLVELDPASAQRVDQRIKTVCSHVATTAARHEVNVEAWTHFTHFDILETRIEEISTEYLWYCWKRGVAIQMAHPQHGIDGIIPVFVGDLDRPLIDDRDDGTTMEPRADANSGLTSTELGPEDLQEPAQEATSTPAGRTKAPAPRSFRGEILAARQMTYVAWEAKNRQESTPTLADAAAKKKAHAGPLLKHTTGEASELSQRGVFTILADMGASKSHAPRVKNIEGTDSLQMWIRGLEHANNYPCLSTLGIQNVAISFLRTVSEHMDYDKDNMILDPMAFRLAKLTVSGEEDREKGKGKERLERIEEDMMDSSDELEVMDDNLQADETLSSPVAAADSAPMEEDTLNGLDDSLSISKSDLICQPEMERD